MTTFHLDIQYRNQHFLRGGSSMDKVLSASGHLEHIVADRKGNDLCVVIVQNLPHRKALDAFLCHSLMGYDKPSIDKGLFITDCANLFALGKLVPLVNETVIRCHQEAIGIRIGRDFTDQLHDFTYRFLTGNEHLVLRGCLVTARINLIVIDIDQLLAGKNVAQLIFL